MKNLIEVLKQNKERVIEVGKEIFILQDVKLENDSLILRGLDDFLESVKVIINLHNLKEFSFKTKGNYIYVENKEDCLEIFYKNNKTQIINLY